MTANTYSTFRPGAITPESLATALRLHFACHGTRPVGVTVHPTELDHAEQALLALGLPLPITLEPGCLVGEIWLVRGK